jgi:hypothetical protein
LAEHPGASMMEAAAFLGADYHAERRMVFKLLASGVMNPIVLWRLTLSADQP